MVRFVLDANILVAAARSRNGASSALLSRWPSAGVETVISVPHFFEYRDVLLRPENLGTAQSAERFLDFLVNISHLQPIYFLWRPLLVDPGDDLVLEAAVAAGARYLVTHNERHFRGVERFGIKIVKAAEFLLFLPQSK